MSDGFVWLELIDEGNFIFIMILGEIVDALNEYLIVCEPLPLCCNLVVQIDAVII